MKIIPKLLAVVMGASNRPQDVDKAILRRMPTSFHIGLPVRVSIEIIKMWDMTKTVFEYKISRLESNGYR